MNFRHIFLYAISSNRYFNHIVFKRYIEGTKIKHSQKAVFILSTGRTGTKFFAERLAAFEQIKASHEPSPSRVLRFWTNAYIRGEVTKIQMRDVFIKFRARLISRCNLQIYVESNNFMTGFSCILSDVLEDPKIIHIVRDPRTYITSAINKGADSGFKGFVNRYVPYAHLKADRSENYWQIKRSARYWQEVNTELDKLNNHNNYLCVRFEDLFKTDNNTMKKIAEYIGIEFKSNTLSTQRKINKSHLSLHSSWGHWSDEEATIVSDICGDLMDKYNYGKEREWIEKIK